MHLPLPLSWLSTTGLFWAKFQRLYYLVGKYLSHLFLEKKILFFFLLSMEGEEKGKRETNPNTTVIPKLKLIDFLVISKCCQSETWQNRADALFHPARPPPHPHHLYSQLFWIRTRRGATYYFRLVCLHYRIVGYVSQVGYQTPETKMTLNTSFILMHRRTQGRRRSGSSISVSSGSLACLP